MRHHNKNKKFGRETGQRDALLRSLTEGLVKHGRIETSLIKAKALRRFIEPMITKGKKPTLATRKLIISRFGTEARAKKFLTDVAPRYLNRAGGYTRVIKLPIRKGDGSARAIIELV